MRAARGAIGLERFAWPRPAVPHAWSVSVQTLAQGAIGECKARGRGSEVPTYDAPLACISFLQNISVFYFRKGSLSTPSVAA